LEVKEKAMSLVHITILEKELEVLENNSSSVPRLTRKTIRQYLHERIKTISNDMEEVKKAKKLLSGAQHEKDGN